MAEGTAAVDKPEAAIDHNFVEDKLGLQKEQYNHVVDKLGALEALVDIQAAEVDIG